MNREQYIEKRKGLMDEAQKLLDSGDMAAFDAKTKEVEDLDNTYDAVCKAQANLNALNDKTQTSGFSGMAANTGAGSVVVERMTKAGNSNMYDSDEYKAAFMNYVVKGTPIPAQFSNADANTKTTDVGSVIPSTTLQKIYEKMEKTGMVLPLVTRTSYRGGLTVPTSSVKPMASWVSEGSGSDKQKKTTGSIVFAYHKLRCAISMSFEVANMAYPMFETVFVQNVSEAMVKAKEIAILRGTGSGQPKGILQETAASTIELTEGDSITWADLANAEAEEMDEGAVWCMTKKTFMSQIVGMVDVDGQPIARVNTGVGGKPEYTILGRRVVQVNPEYMDSWASTVAADTVIAFMYNFSDYILNTPVAMTTKRYYDEDLDDEILKAVELCDGKSVRNDSLVTVTIKNTTT